MSEDRASTSGESSEGGSKDLFCTHTVSKLDTLAGIAVKYKVTVSDIKRANGLLSDSAMFARDTLLIPTRSMPVGQEYSTWAGMIVTQYGRLPGSHSRGRSDSLFNGGGHPQQSAALEQLRGYYGLGAASEESVPRRAFTDEPRSFRNLDSRSENGRTSSGEVELTEFEPSTLRRPPSLPNIEYAGTREGQTFDERLRRRRANESSPLRDSSASISNVPTDATSPGGTAKQQRPPLSRDGSNGSGGVAPPAAAAEPPAGIGGGGPGRGKTRGQKAHEVMQGRRRESFLDKIKRAASQPALAGPSGPNLAKLADAAITSVAEGAGVKPSGGSATGSSNLQKVVAAVQPQKLKEIAKKD
ncbi:hypothetical protein WJX72_001978 [[Myrmecia] bisecta]|uniref:LysM domain-containing protein n=1 Tax=[Myrmecia] bisecta TaxID=41462 RepID=A0AAW1PZV7_9CHLO